MFFPLPFKLFCYKKFFGFNLEKGARIGFSLVASKSLVMAHNSKIGHLNVIKSLSLVSLDEFASIGSMNWISGFPENTGSPHFADQMDRIPRLLVGKHSAITNRHLIDCTNTVKIGCFTTFAGFRSQILTHSISITESRQRSGTVEIGDYSFVGTGSILLPNSFLPNFCVLGAGSVLNKRYVEEYKLYAGNPARPVKDIDINEAYFTRKVGFVV